MTNRKECRWFPEHHLHLGINAIVYGAAIYWERCHIVHHLAACNAAAAPEPVNTTCDALRDAA